MNAAQREPLQLSASTGIKSSSAILVVSKNTVHNANHQNTVHNANHQNTVHNFVDD